MDEDKIRTDQEFEQLLAMARDYLPRIWRNLYEGCIEEGFTEQQSMELVFTYIKKD